MPLINCDTELHLSWTNDCVLIEQNNNIKLYVPVVNLCINDNNSFIENIKQGFKRTISWNKYRSETTT